MLETPGTGYLLAVLAIASVITFALRAVPFVVLQPLRDSPAVAAMARWMPVGILVVLTASTLGGSIGAAPGRLVPVLIAVAVTIAAHLLGGRRTLLSVGLGTVTFVLLVNLL
jgi:branched-subunit amino acid transport protein AzlD